MTTGISLEYERLWEVGTRHLPLLVRDLDETCELVRVAAAGHAFAGFLCDATGDKWFEACKELEDVLWYTQEAVADASRAVCQVVTGYAATDQAAADAIDRSRTSAG